MARVTPVRVSAVGYLNARPLTFTLDAAPDWWAVRYDVPSVCAALLHSDEADLGLIPSVEFLQFPDYRFVPGVAIGSFGPVASVALFTAREIGDIRHIALDTTSRTSAALLRILCERRFGIQPQFVPQPPNLGRMLAKYDAALMIGDRALDVDAPSLGLRKIDLGLEWTTWTGAPFIYAAWTGRPDALRAADVAGLQRAQADGLRAIDAIARAYAPGDAGRQARAAAYLRDNVRYGLGPEETAGLQLFLDYAAALGIGPRRRVEFF
jgi:chorismate dehydratase